MQPRGIMFDETMTDHEFAEALRESQAELFGRSHPAEPDLTVEGLNHSFVSRLFALFLPKGPD